MFKVSKELGDFYVAVQEWIDNGVDNPIFNEKQGLCANLEEHLISLFMLDTYKYRLLEEMKAQFILEGLDKELPFNTTIESYVEDVKYTNPKRLAWIKKYSDIAKEERKNEM